MLTTVAVILTVPSQGTLLGTARGHFYYTHYLGIAFFLPGNLTQRAHRVRLKEAKLKAVSQVHCTRGASEELGCKNVINCEGRPSPVCHPRVIRNKAALGYLAHRIYISHSHF